MTNCVSVLRKRQHDIKPKIRIAKSDFKIFAKKKAFLNRETFVSMMREQLYTYIQSRLSSKSEFWSDSPHEFNSIGPLKYLMMELIRTKQRTEQPAAAAVASTTLHKQPTSVNSGAGLTLSAAACGSPASGGSTGSAAEICAIGELVLQLGRAAGEGDMTRQIAVISERLQRLAGGARTAQDRDKRQEGNGASSPVISSIPSSGMANGAAASGRSEAESPIPVLAAPPTRDQRSFASTTLLGSQARKAKPGPPGPAGGPPAGDPPGDGRPAGGDQSESSVSPRRMEASGSGLAAVRIRPFDGEARARAQHGGPPGALAGLSGSVGDAGGAFLQVHDVPRRTTPPQALLHERLLQSEGAGGRRGGRRGNSNSPAGPSSHPGFQGHGASSLHYQGRSNDVVLVSGVGSPVGRSFVGSHAAVRSTWIEPTLL
jgi:hypothetical protein